MDYLRLKPRHLAWLALAAWLPALAQPLLRCQVTYAGTTHTLQSQVVQDPYVVPSVDIGGRFLFKAVMVGLGQRIDYIKLYAYLDGKRQPVLLQVAKYLPPFKASATPYLLTGQQYIYGGPVERELIYSCTLEGTP